MGFTNSTGSVTSISKFTPKTLGKNLILTASQQLLSVFLPLGSGWKPQAERQELLLSSFQDVMGKWYTLFEIKPDVKQNEAINPRFCECAGNRPGFISDDPQPVRHLLLDLSSHIKLNMINIWYPIKQPCLLTSLLCFFPRLHRHNCPPSFQLSPSPACCQAHRRLHSCSVSWLNPSL